MTDSVSIINQTDENVIDWDKINYQNKIVKTSVIFPSWFKMARLFKIQKIWPLYSINTL